MRSITRKNFLAAAGATAAVAGLAACSSDTEEEDATEEVEEAEASTDDPLAAPDASAYPIDPDDDTVEALWTSETSRKDQWTCVTNPDGGAELGVMDTSIIIQVNGYAFKDLNGNGKLDLYEDWRQSDEDRAASLASQLSYEEIAPLMWHDGLTSTSEVTEDDEVTLSNGLRAGVSRAGADEDNYVEALNWQNEVQAYCEANGGWGIPYMNSTDPYQLYDIPDPHCIVSAFDPDLWRKAGHYLGRAWRATGVRVDLGPQVDIGTNITYTRMGGSICEDPAANRDMTKAYCGGMQSTWGDADCTEDEGWGKDSVACMLKHYVGGGAVEGGRNDHAEAGKFNIFPNDNFNAHLIPFLDGGLNLDSVTGQMAAVMTNYGLPYSEDGSLYGGNYAGAYNKRNVSILRNAGWDGMITTDWGILQEPEDSGRPWGVEDLTISERVKRMVDVTVSQVGGEFNYENALEAYEILAEEVGEDEALAAYQEAARRIFVVMFHVQLFDNPYYDREYAAEVLEDEEAFAFGQECSDKSIVMLKNAGNVIAEGGITGQPVCYIPTQSSGGSDLLAMLTGSSSEVTLSMPLDEDLANEIFTVVTDNTDDDGNLVELTSDDNLFGISTTAIDTEDYLPISLQYREYTATVARDPSYAGNTLDDGTKENRSYNGRTVTASNEDDLDRLIEIREALPDAKIILAVEATNNAQCFHEIEPYADVILWSWASDGRDFSSAYCRILNGENEPSALLPCQMPLDMDAVEAQCEDVPRDMDCYVDSEGNTYDFCFGLNWSGVIDDDRVATYKVSPLTEPETTVEATEEA